MDEHLAQNLNAQTVRARQGENPRRPYPHQIEAIGKLDQLNKRKSFSTMLVLPTGAGKTMTATMWLLSAAVDKKKKILWIAHRHLLLEQAADSFTVNAYDELLINQKSFKYRIISGQNDSPIHTKKDDDILIASKDSLIRRLHTLDEWLKKEDDLYFIIDEAHHATAKSYRRIIDFIKSKNLNVKMLGLTATPLRTSKKEEGLLGKIFTDPDGGMVYEVDLQTLIKREILSTPKFESYDTNMMIGNELGVNAIKSIERLDVIPEDIAQHIIKNKERNRFIVETYLKDDNYKKYGQTLVFALNRLHALTLQDLFNKLGKEYGIKAGVIISGVHKEFIGIDISNEENSRQIEAYKKEKPEIQVLINVNILTEGVDLPKTKTVFLTRPTISSVLITQMIGRALRGEKAGGTKDANIVSFIDNWNEKIAWVNPESILDGEGDFKPDKEYEYKKRIIRMISIEKLNEFAQIANEAVDTRILEGVDFIKRIPLGMYAFTFIDENSLEHNHQILVYDNSQHIYRDIIEALPAIFKDFGVEDEVIEDEVLLAMITQCEDAYFDEDMVPPYNPHSNGGKDVEYLLKFFAQKESTPLFIPFEKPDREKVNISSIAKKIFEENMGRAEQTALINSLWEDEASLLRTYFGNKYFFVRQLNIELDKLSGFYQDIVQQIIRTPEERSLEDMPLHKWPPEPRRMIRDSVFNGARTKEGLYRCANPKCKKESSCKGLFQLDHIVPISKGGKTKLDNLQLLCWPCNKKKGDSL